LISLRFFLLFILLTVCASNFAQTVKFIDNKGTLKTIDIVRNDMAEIYDTTGGQSISEGVFSDINFSTAGIVDSSSFSATANAITIKEAGRYEIIYRVTTQTANNERNGGEFYLEVSGIESPGTRAYTYSRNNVVDKNTVTVFKVLSVTKASLIKVKGQVYASAQGGTSSALKMVANGSSLVVKKVR
jgi:hypothetical protein